MYWNSNECWHVKLIKDIYKIFKFYKIHNLFYLKVNKIILKKIIYFEDYLYISCYSSLAGRQANLTQILYMCDSLQLKNYKLYLILFVPLWRIFKTKEILKRIDNKFKIKIIPIPLLKIKGIYLLFDIVII